MMKKDALCGCIKPSSDAFKWSFVDDSK